MSAPEALTIETYPWPAIDARDLLRRVEIADKELEDQWAMAHGIIDEHSARIAELEGNGRVELDYNDQCDLAFGRLRRLVDKKPELLKHLSGLSAIDLGVDGLGLSGEQVGQVIQQIQAIEAQDKRHVDSTEAAWGLIANATDWDRDDRKEWREAAERWRDRNGKGAPPEPISSVVQPVSGGA